MLQGFEHKYPPLYPDVGRQTKHLKSVNFYNDTSNALAKIDLAFFCWQYTFPVILTAFTVILEN